MALPPPSTTFSTSTEAFKYPLPTVRQFHKQLQSALDEKNARLRTLVGGSYRQLLGTAEMIVDMRRDIELAENKLAKVAEGCGRSAIGKKVSGLGRLGVVVDGGIGREVNLGWLARMKVLDGCVLIIGRLLSGKESAGLQGGQGKGERLVIAAKVLVLSRLLIKGLGDEIKNEEHTISGGEEIINEMKRKLGVLRKRLLRVVGRILENIDAVREDLVQALCAYSLATSSGVKDVLIHFLRVRGEAMALAFEEDEETPKKQKEESILHALGLFTKTLLDVQALVPRQLSDALLALKGKPLLKDDAVRHLEGLRLDVSERWFGDEIVFFTPYIRHDELDGSSVGDMLKSWAKRASEVLLGGFEKTLGRITEFKMVVELRTKIFKAWISEGGKVKGFDSSIMLDGLRKVVNYRLVYLLETRIGKLHLVGTEIEAVLDSWASGVTKMQTGLWNDEMIHMEINGGAENFKKAILSGTYGRNNSVSRVIKGYETWRFLIDELVTSVEQLRSQRWDDDIESLEDDETLENRNNLLSKDDPYMLQDHIDTNLEKAYKALHQKIAGFLATHMEDNDAGGIATFLLRILRDIRAALPQRPDLKSFGLSFIPDLHTILAASVSSAPTSSFIASITSRKHVIGRSLWEGRPELPINPSPGTFRYFHSLTSSMAIAGNDLWSPAAVILLKRHLRDALGLEWGQLLDSHYVENKVHLNGHKNGDSDETSGADTANEAKGEAGVEAEVEAEVEKLEATDGTPASPVDDNSPAANPDQKVQQQDILIQSLFDVYILQHALQLPLSAMAAVPTKEDRLINLEESLKSRLELSDPEMQRLQLGAREYWKRTGLLFGLLG